MKHAITGMKLAISLAVLSAGPAFTQTPSDEAISNKAAVPVAHVYVQTTPGVMVFTAAANGKLTPVTGSPFKTIGQIEDISGKFLISVGTTYLHTYPIEPNGRIGKQVFQTNTANFGGSECGGTSDPNGNDVPNGSVLVHSGKYLYVQLYTWAIGGCAAWQSYRVEPDGFLQFIGDMEYSDPFGDGFSLSSTPPTISSNDKFGYGAFFAGDPTNNSWSAFQIAADGELEINSSFIPISPDGGGKYNYTPLIAQADNAGHLAVVENIPWISWQIASFTINPTNGQVSTTSNLNNMPYTGQPFSMHMSPSGKLLAVGEYGGLEIFHFNGANPVTRMSSPLLDSLLNSAYIDQVAWDNDNHLYAHSYDSAQLYVFTVTPTSITQAPGSPYQLPSWFYNSSYGVRGLIVTK